MKPHSVASDRIAQHCHSVPPALSYDAVISDIRVVCGCFGNAARLVRAIVPSRAAAQCRVATQVRSCGRPAAQCDVWQVQPHGSALTPAGLLLLRTLWLTRTHAHACAHIHAHSHAHDGTHASTRTHTHSRTTLYARTHARTQSHTHTRARADIRTHTYARTHTRVHTHARTHARTLRALAHVRASKQASAVPSQTDCGLQWRRYALHCSTTQTRCR
jgi:hypothetical protein